MRDLPVRIGEPLFLDSVHLIASFSPSDNWRAPAIAAAAEIPPQQPLVTSEGVILESLAHFARQAGPVRIRLGRWIASLRDDPRYTIVPHDRRLSEAALDLYTGEFADSTFSLQDCAEIVMMREYGITSILTANQEFARAGFAPLLRRYVG